MARYQGSFLTRGTTSTFCCCTLGGAGAGAGAGAEAWGARDKPEGWKTKNNKIHHAVRRSYENIMTHFTRYNLPQDHR